MSRFAKQNRVFFIEEPWFDAEHTNHLQLDKKDNLTVVIPHLQHGLSDEEIVSQQVRLLKDLFEEESVINYFMWYYSPMPLAIGNSFYPKFIIYDCMDELSLFKDAPAILKEREKELFSKADLVFTGGHNLYQAKKDSHDNIHPSQAVLIKNILPKPVISKPILKIRHMFPVQDLVFMV
jgi:UDP-galactopyranose mutase